MIRFFSFLLILVLSGCSFSRNYAVFKNVPVDTSTKFYFIQGEGTPLEFERELGNFIITDTIVQRKLIREWRFTDGATVHACGNSYYVFAVWKNGKKNVSINSECGTISADGRLLNFDRELLRNLDLTRSKKLLKTDRDSILYLLRN